MIALGEPPWEPVRTDPRPLVLFESLSEQSVCERPSAGVERVKELCRPASPRFRCSECLDKAVIVGLVQAVCQKGTETVGTEALADETAPTIC